MIGQRLGQVLLSVMTDLYPLARYFPWENQNLFKMIEIKWHATLSMIGSS